MTTKILTLFFSLFLFLSCSSKNFDIINSVYHHTTEINSIVVKGPFKVFVTEYTHNTIIIITNQFVYDKVSVVVDDKGTLSAVVGNIGESYEANKITLELYVPAKYLKNIELYGLASCTLTPTMLCKDDASYTLSNASSLVIDSKAVFSKSLDITLKDASVMQLKMGESIVVENNLKVDSYDASTLILNTISIKEESRFRLNNASKVIISGESQSNVILNNSGASKFEGLNFLCSNLNYSASGSSYTEVAVNKDLSIIMEGASKLKYKKGSSDFEIVNLSSSGSSSIEEVK